jgi:photosystem II stability/assembly factor-like uncharacterized protein
MKLLLVCCLTASAQTWVMQESGTTASLRGVSAVNERVVWASGTGGTCIKTTDGGAHWTAAKVPGAENLDFRDMHAVDERTVYLMSAGKGNLSRIYKTTDGGAHWALAVENPDGEDFFDAVAFWDANHGIVLGDPVRGRFVIYTTSDGNWWHSQLGPEAQKSEGAFAASGTCLTVGPGRRAWFGSGGPGGGRVFRSEDGGATWTAAPTPVRKDSDASGIFSLAFSDALHGVAVGGRYTADRETAGNLAVTSDGGRTWSAPKGHPGGYRSAVAWVPSGKVWVAVGTSGSDISRDGGEIWAEFDTHAFNAVAFVSSGEGWAVGPKGAVARFSAR